MPRDIPLSNGLVLRNVPAETTVGGAVDLAVQKGLITPNEAAETLQQFDPQQVGQQSGPELPETRGIIDELRIGGGKFFADRIPGIDNSVAAPDTLAAGVGAAIPAIALSLAAPGTVGAQALVGLGLEATRKGSTVESTGIAGLTQGAFAGLGNLATRTAGQIGAAGQRIAQTLGTKTGNQLAQRLEAGISSGGGFDFLKKAVTKQLNSTLARSIGQNADELSPAVLADAAAGIGSIFESIVPKAAQFNIAGLRSSLDDLAAGTAGVRVSRAMPKADDVTGSDIVAIRAALVDRIRTLAGQAPEKADDLAVVVDDLDKIISGSLGDDVLPLLRIAREAWKNLKLIESMPTVVRTGNASAPQLIGKLAGRKGYGTTFTRNSGGVLPETQAVFDIARQAGRLSEIVGDSGTATRLAALGLIGTTAGFALEGDLEGALKGAAIGLSPALLGRLNVAAAAGPGSALATRAAGAASTPVQTFLRGLGDDNQRTENTTAD